MPVPSPHSLGRWEHYQWNQICHFLGESTTYRGTLGSREAGGALGSIGSLGTENVQFEEMFFLLAAPIVSSLWHWLHLKAFPFTLALLSPFDSRQNEKRGSRC